jgi:hypothetical protein
MSFKTGLLLILSLTANVVMAYLLVSTRAGMAAALTDRERERLRAEIAEIDRQWMDKASPEKREALYLRLKEKIAQLAGDAAGRSASSAVEQGAPGTAGRATTPPGEP